MRRGEVWWVGLPDPVGSEPGYRRPVLIVQDDVFTESRIRTIVVVAITSNMRLARAPGNVQVSPIESGLPKNSVVNVSQIITADKTFLVERVGALPPKTMRRIDEGVRLVLSI